MLHVLNRLIHGAALAFVLAGVSLTGLLTINLQASLVAGGGSSLIGLHSGPAEHDATMVASSLVETSGRFSVESLLFLGLLIFLVGFVVHALVVAYRQPVRQSGHFLHTNVYLPGRMALRLMRRLV